MNRASFRFHGELNDFLPKKQRRKAITREFDWRGSVKDMVESLNVPHPEVALLVVNGRSVSFDYIVGDGDSIDAYPAQHTCSVTPQVDLRPPLLDKPRFILDTHLGRLAAYLRMAGFDTLYRNDYPDDVLAQVAFNENRVLLTRDIGLLKRSIVQYGYFVRETNPRRRLAEVTRRFTLGVHGNQYARCTRCNGVLKAISKADVKAMLSDRTASHYDTFYQCRTCGQIYWKGSHYERTQAFIQEALGTA